MSIDKLDLKIISSLEENGRISYARLAKSIGLNVTTVAKRVESLLNDNVITINAIPNSFKLGYQSQAIIALNVDLNHIVDVSNSLKKIFNVNIVATTFGRYNLVMAVFFASWNDLHRFIASELALRGDINEMDIFFVNTVKKRHYGFSNNLDHSQEAIKIDFVDQQIIESLTLNGRESCSSLANRLGISLSSASKRVARLLNDEVITVQAQTTTKAGYRADAFLLIKCDHGKIDRICSELQAHEEVITVMTLLNGYDIFISIISENTEKLYESIRSKIAGISGISVITGMETLVRGEIIKRYYGNFRVDHQIFNKHNAEVSK